MGKMDYLDALKLAMLGLPPDVQARTLAFYEQRFVDGEAAGRTEGEVGRELDDPKTVALALRESAHLHALHAHNAQNTPGNAGPANAAMAARAPFAAKKNPARALRLMVSAAGLAIFNLFMIVPAMVYSALLFALYVAALAFYLAGIATTASGLAGTNELVLDWPTRYINLGDDGDDLRGRQLRIEIGDHGINVHPERAPAAADDTGGADDQSSTSQDSADGDGGGQDSNESRRAHSRVLRGAEALADGTVRITTGMDAQSRTTQTAFGFGMVLGGIGLCLLAIVVTRYSVIGLKRYLHMNLSLLRGNGG